MCEHDKIVLVKGKDRTDIISSYQFVGKRCDITYKDRPKIYSYNRKNVTVLTNCLSDKRCHDLFEYFAVRLVSSAVFVVFSLRSEIICI